MSDIWHKKKARSLNYKRENGFLQNNQQEKKRKKRHMYRLINFKIPAVILFVFN